MTNNHPHPRCLVGEIQFGAHAVVALDLVAAELARPVPKETPKKP